MALNCEFWENLSGILSTESSGASLKSPPKIKYASSYFFVNLLIWSKSDWTSFLHGLSHCNHIHYRSRKESHPQKFSKISPVNLLNKEPTPAERWEALKKYAWSPHWFFQNVLSVSLEWPNILNWHILQIVRDVMLYIT